MLPFTLKAIRLISCNFIINLSSFGNVCELIKMRLMKSWWEASSGDSKWAVTTSGKDWWRLSYHISSYWPRAAHSEDFENKLVGSFASLQLFSIHEEPRQRRGYEDTNNVQIRFILSYIYFWISIYPYLIHVFWLLKFNTSWSSLM